MNALKSIGLLMALHSMACPASMVYGTYHSSDIIFPSPVIEGVSLTDPVLDTAAIERMALGLGIPLDSLSFVKSYHEDNFDPGSPYNVEHYLPGFKRSYSRDQVILLVDTLPLGAGEGYAVLNHGKSEYWRTSRAGWFYTYTLSWKVFDRPYSNLLMDRYLLETGDTTFKDSDYAALKQKSLSEFWKRNLISQAWGAQYVYLDNPFSQPSVGGSIFLGYAADGGLAALFTEFAIETVSRNGSANEKIAKVGEEALFTAALSLVYKLMAYHFEKKSLLEYTKFVNYESVMPKPSAWKQLEDSLVSPMDTVNVQAPPF